VTTDVGHADLAATLEAVRRRGARAVVDEALGALAASPPGVLVGPPLVALARADADRLDASAARLPLHGVPFVVKDNIDVGGVATTAACPGFSYVASEDATIVAALRAAGAVVVGKANLDQFATGLVGTRSPYGVPPNALDPDLVPGGSSSGSAAAVALGYVPFSVGTDTAGSGRVPAALNGIVGYKPTVGRYDTTGVVPAMRRFDCPSVFARSALDARRVAAAMGPVAAPAATAMPARPTVAVAVTWPDEVDVEPAVEASYRAGVEALARAGAVLVPVDIAPLLDLGRLLYGSALVAERTLAAGDAIRADVAGLDAHVASIIRGGWTFGADDAYRTEYELAERRAAAQEVVRPVDVLALPTTPVVPTLAAVAADPLGINERLGAFTTFANLLGLPVVVVPAPERVPCGLQLVGTRPWADDSLLAMATRMLGDRPPAAGSAGSRGPLAATS
jgi:allophanate hydrolase